MTYRKPAYEKVVIIGINRPEVRKVLNRDTWMGAGARLAPQIGHHHF